MQYFEYSFSCIFFHLKPTRYSVLNKFLDSILFLDPILYADKDISILSYKPYLFFKEEVSASFSIDFVCF